MMSKYMKFSDSEESLDLAKDIVKTILKKSKDEQVVITKEVLEMTMAAFASCSSNPNIGENYFIANGEVMSFND